MANYEFKGYDNSVLEEQIKSTLDTKLDINRFMTADYELSENPGMVKKIHKYVASGEVDDLERGEGNTNFIDAEYTEEEYRVARSQGQARWYDDDAMTDPTLIDTKVKGLSEAMVNSWTRKAINEFKKTENVIAVTDYSLGSFADTIAVYANRYEDQAGLFFLCAQELVPELRKMLGAELKYTEGYIKTGAVGDILGVPVYTSKAIPKGIIYCATKDAVTAFVKKDVFVEQDRDIDTKENQLVASRYSVIALTDETKCIEMGKAQATAATITTATAGAATVAGAATTGAKVQAYINGVASGVAATASTNAYSITVAENLKAGDIVKVVAVLEGKVKSIATATVA